MLKKKSPSPKSSTLLVIIIVCALALVTGFLLKSQLSEQPVEAANAGQPTAQTLEETVEVTEPLVASEPSEEPTDTIAQTVNGVEIRFEGVQHKGETVTVNVCFDLPDDSDWLIWDTTLEVNGKATRWSTMGPTELRKPPMDGMQQVWIFNYEGEDQIYYEEADESQSGYRCEAINFEGFADLSPSTPATLIIEALEAPPSEGEFCTEAYLEEVQAALDARQTGITVKCTEEEYIGGLEILTKPETISLETAEAYLGSPDFYLDLHGIRGPWVFTFDLD